MLKKKKNWKKKKEKEEATPVAHGGDRTTPKGQTPLICFCFFALRPLSWA